MKTKNLLLVLAISGALVACGSSSSQDSTSKPNKPDSGITKEKGKTELGKNLIVKSTNKADLNHFVLNGKSIKLLPFNAGNLYTQIGSNINGDTLDRIVSGTKFTYSRFGILAPKGQDPVAFTQGEVTSTGDMPTTGTEVKYTGHYATYNTEAKSFADDGALDVTVNFSDKKIKLMLENATAFDGNIKGNQFTFDGNQGKGQFYGPQAAELGAVHKNQNSISVFGAKK